MDSAEKVVDVIIPAYHPGKEFPALLKRLAAQTYPIRRLIIMNTQKEYWKESWESLFPSIKVHHITREEFDHGGTRKTAADHSDADVLVFMTQDAVPADQDLIANLIRALFSRDMTAAAYARQLPRDNCSFTECYTRLFNYPEQPHIRTKQDLPVYGIKTFFCSNVCAAYRGDVYRKTGGFIARAIFNEDMIYAGRLVQEGYGIAYAADARVIHSHNYSCMQQFHRNFDLGVSQADHPEIFSLAASEGEGIRLVKSTIEYLLRRKKVFLIPGFILQSGCKYAGYFLGKHYQKLPRKLILACTMNRSYWK